LRFARSHSLALFWRNYPPYSRCRKAFASAGCASSGFSPYYEDIEADFYWFAGFDGFSFEAVIIGFYILGTVFYQFMVDAHPASALAMSDFLSIDPEKWFPPA
jgi:hypothetical protein